MQNIKTASRKTNHLRRNMAGPFLTSTVIHLILIAFFGSMVSGNLLEKKSTNSTFSVTLLHAVSEKSSITSLKRPDILTVLNSDNKYVTESVTDAQEYNPRFPAAAAPAWQQMPDWISPDQKDAGNPVYYLMNNVQSPAIPVKTPELTIDFSSINENDILLVVDLYINDKGIVEKSVVISTHFDAVTANQMANQLGHTLFHPALKDSHGVPYLMRVRVTAQGIDEIPPS